MYGRMEDKAMDDLIIFYRVLLAICSGAAALWGGIKIINEIRKPRLELEKDVKNLEQELTEMKKEFHSHEESAEKINKQLLAAVENLDKKIDVMADKIHEENKKYSVLSANSLLAIGNHLISGNDVKKISEANTALVNYLMEN